METEYDSRHVVGTHEIAAMLGVTRSRVNQMARERGGLPKPLGVLRMGKVWRRSDIETWMRKRNDTG